jgi:23S rRNA pseudouridine955/2504/2580 synthase
MQSITVTGKGANTKIEQYLQAVYPALPFGVLQKAFRRRDIKANGVKVGKDYIVAFGDKLEIYITDEFLFGMGNTGESMSEGKFTVAYEDDNLIIVNKAPGIPVHPDREQSQETLIDLVRAYLRERYDYSFHSFHSFQPELCHRLDRNTGGLVIIAKNKASHDFIIEKLESREIKKYYQCLVAGKMEKKEARLQAYLWKDAAKSRVFISDHKKPGAQEIITTYRVLEYDKDNDISRLEIELVTGRTHQIRAHMAYIGHPVIGDGKYGKNVINRAFGLKQQALWACRLKFDLSKDSELMESSRQMKSSQLMETSNQIESNRLITDNKSLIYSDLLKELNGLEISVEPGFMPDPGKSKGLPQAKGKPQTKGKPQAKGKPQTK